MKTPWLDTITNTGIVTGIAEDEARSVRIVNLFSFFTAILVVIYGLIFYLISGEISVLYPALLLSVCFLSVVFLGNRRRAYVAGKIGLQLVFCSVLLYYGPILGAGSGVQLLSLLLVGMPFLVFTRQQWRWRSVGIALPLLCVLLLEYNNAYPLIQPLSLSAEVQQLFRWLIMGVVALLHIMIIRFYQTGMSTLLLRLQSSHEALEGANEQLARSNHQLEETVRERTRALTEQNQALQEAKDMADRASQEKSAFLRETSHEIRNPLNAMQGIIYMLLNEGESDAVNVMNLLHKLHFNCLGLQELLNNTLQLSQIENGHKEHISQQPFMVRDWLHALGNTYRMAGKDKRVKVSIALADDVPDCIIGDKVHLTRVLNNLMINALKFTPGNRSVYVYCFTGEDVQTKQALWYIRIADEGVGIPVDKQADIFLPFERADKQIAYDQGGTGLGLPISRRLIEAMGGSISVDSVEGVGTTFLLTLPLIASETPVAVLPKAPLAALPEGKRVVLMEDNEMNQVIMQRFLTGLGVSVTIAGDGHTGMELVRSVRPHLVILDIRMPVKDGKQVVKELRNAPELCHIPVIAVSGNAFTDEAEEAFRCGVDEYLPKPLQYQQLHELLLQYLGRKENVLTA